MVYTDASHRISSVRKVINDVEEMREVEINVIKY